MIFELDARFISTHHLTSILATHNLSLARRTDRVLQSGTREAGAGRRSARGIARHSTAQAAECWGEDPGRAWVTRV